ncbi:MAG: tol-pal system protein YbgF [Thermodesulfovibrionales bacterium]|nr:tol-pal system protein YbgF [Thermodesulfovibrionales bacterium]
MKRIFLVLLLLVSGCATTADFEMLKADMNQLKKDSYDARKESSELKADLAELKAGAVKEEAFNAIRESEASLRSEVSGISKDLQTITGRFDENKYFIDKSLKDKSSEVELLRLQIIALETQLKELQGGKPPSRVETDSKTIGKQDIKKEKKTEPEEAKIPEAKPEIKDPAKMYEAAYSTFKEKKFKEAREKFEAFLKEFPKDSLAGNAQFWIGESYYAEEDYAGAIVEYDALLKNYPNSEKAIGALLKQGYAFIEMGDKKAAKGILEQLREKYPKSKEAELAKRKLEDMNKKSK